jgi:hypothetical protein
VSPLEATAYPTNSGRRDVATALASLHRRLPATSVAPDPDKMYEDIIHVRTCKVGDTDNMFRDLNFFSKPTYVEESIDNIGHTRNDRDGNKTTCVYKFIGTPSRE